METQIKGVITILDKQTGYDWKYELTPKGHLSRELSRG